MIDEFEMEEQRMATFQGGALSALDVEECELALEVLVGVLRVRDPRGVPPLGAVRIVHHLAQAGGNCIKIGLPGKSILRFSDFKRIGLPADLFSY